MWKSRRLYSYRSRFYTFSKVPTSNGNQYQYRIERLAVFVDEMLELFGGTHAHYLLHELTYKEAIALRDARIERKTKEIKKEEEMRKKINY